MNLRRFSPLGHLPKQRQIWSWISYDVANQSFTLIINTLLFSIFFGKVVVQDDTRDDGLWALAFGSSMLLAALMSPIVGAAADERAWKKTGLVLTAIICATFTCALAFIPAGNVWLALALYIPANCAFALGENFLASFLPALATEKDVGRLSAFSWGLAYLAALLLLVLTAGSMLLFKVGGADEWRPYFIFAGLWFFAFTIPTIIGLKEPPIPQEKHGRRNFIIVGIRRLAESIHHLRGYRDLALLLLASLFYGTGMSVVVSFASKLANEYGFDQVRLVLFMAVITISGVLGTLVPLKFQDRVGHRRICLMLLGVWVFAACGFALYAHLYDAHGNAGGVNFPSWPLWVIGNLLGFGLGSLGSANRAFVSYLAPPERAAEIFGIWGLMFKLAALMTFPFAWMKDRAGTSEALLLLAGFIIIGFILTCFINEKRGRAAAEAPGDPS
ncbi:MAG: MFS transporter [Verrucomicrobiota bacterium]